VVDRGVENVGPELDRPRDGLAIERVLGRSGIAEVRPETDRRERQALRLAEMPGIADRETVAKPSRALGRGVARGERSTRAHRISEGLSMKDRLQAVKHKIQGGLQSRRLTRDRKSAVEGKSCNPR